MGPFALTGAAAIWGGMYVVTKALFAVLPPWVLLDLRYWLALLPLGGVAYARGALRVGREDLPLLVAMALVGYVGSIGMQFWGTQYAGAAMGSLVTSASPALITLLAPLLVGEPWSRRGLFAVGVATAGVVLATGLPAGRQPTQHGVEGSLLLLGAALAWAVYTLLGRRLTRRRSSLTVTTWVTLLGAVATLPLAATEWKPEIVSRLLVGEVAAGVLFVAWAATALAFFLWNYGFENVPPAQGALFFFAQPIVGAGLGWLALGERLSWGFWAGGLLICAGVWITVVRHCPAT